MKSKRWIGIAAIVGIIIIICIFTMRTSIDPNAYCLDGFYISLDSEIWDYERASPMYPITSEIGDLLNGAEIVRTRAEEDNFQPDKMISLQIEHYYLKEYTFKEYMDYLEEQARIRGGEYTRKEMLIDGYDAVYTVNKSEDRCHCTWNIGEGNYYYAFNYLVDAEDSEYYMENVEQAVKTIRITSMDKVDLPQYEMHIRE